MKLPKQFAAAAPAPPTNRCSSCHRRGGFVRDRGSIIRKCLFCGNTEAVPPTPATAAYVPPPKPAPVAVRFAWETAA